MNNLLESALFYRSLGWSVIPLSAGAKIPPKGFSVIPFRERLATEDEIRGWWKENPKYNVGIVTGKLSNLFVVDIDSKEGEENILQYIPDTTLTPTVETPRGGQHMFFKYPDKNITIGAGIIKGTDFRGEGGYVVASPSSNGNGKSYKWRLDPRETPIVDLPQQYINTIYNNNSNSLYRDDDKSLLQSLHLLQNVTNFSEEGRRNQDLFHVANQLKKGGSPREEIAKVLVMLGKQCTPPVNEKEIIAIVDSACKYSEKKERNVSAEVREWILLNDVTFLLKDCYMELKLVTSADMLSARVTINRMIKEGLVEKHREFRGTYRLKQKSSLEPMKFIKGDIEEFPIVLPLGLNDMVALHPKNIVIIAGSKGAGKTAMMLTMALANQNNMPVVYFNSEMGDEEYSQRLKNMGIYDESQIKFETYPLHKDFHDHITEERKIFIVDFLEIHDNFYEIAKPIRQIHEQLKDGICIIAIQMKGGSTIGRGGDFSKEKARLYLAMDFVPEMACTKITIEDGKNPKGEWRNDGVRNMWRHIKILGGGADISPLNGWSNTTIRR